ncbi:MAG: MYXO-CTERM sorting domain-containing protein [Phycisphaerales bacterium]
MKKTLSALAILALAGAADAQIVNGDFQAGNTGFTSGFSYETTGGSPGMTDEATYSIVSFDTLHPSWGDFYDHTFGNSDGLFMIVNGARPGTPFGPAWGQTVNVTPGTDYTLSMWLASVYPGAPAAVEFRIDGAVVLPTVQLGSVVGAWEQHSVSFNSGAATSVLIEIWDTSGIQSGNDYAIDDITLTPTPGAAALAGMGGLAALRRRRR